MTVSEFVDKVLCVPVTRVGYRLIIEALELVLDTREYKFYNRLAEIHNTTPRYLEKALRDAKNLGLDCMALQDKEAIFNKEETPATSEYIIKAAEYYRREYEEQES